MPIERGAISAGRRAERPAQVICKICGRACKLLHKPHLRVHGIASQVEYREMYDIGYEVPLNSRDYADLRREVQEHPEKQQQTRLMVKNWLLQKRVALALLERQNFYTPSRVSEITKIPVQTIHSAIKRQALPCGQIGLLVETNRGLVASGEAVVKGVTLEDMVKFAQGHTPKYPPKG
ncbi:hypothetical protein A3J19_03485 [Candidatus Daviesbacteria bacterium RIFCSPLOWO2_02_FULL_41_8]|uniref:Uncharacterized protein n=2 Tax=Candidatus Daviesiibacteriota TaxID=1752718 RepID=A0A1F5NH66_9BACT|nr:MAG: hypothetical protein A3D83_04160 [Candidatus Daviesbacteria bacterium RIFCSPHIGHO2_02_FULL_41_10]OGE76965.1 MAG: hypothetical protein A3J19_03485 [Candidatus Daviesbacteria bacterium RIFCSPLOWO2_02_FULL_41_8]